MKNMLYKEFKLSVHPTCYLFLLLSSMLLIPNYPYYVSFFYQTLGIFFIFVGGQANNDVYFTTLLPIPKRDAVKARCMTIVILELLQIVVSIPFAIIRGTLIPLENQAGMEANVAFFGLVFVMFGLFNLSFLTLFYKTAYKMGVPYLFACISMTVFVGLSELAIQLTPVLKTTMDTFNPVYLPQQLAILLVGILIFVLLTILSYRKAAAHFEQIDL